MVFLLSLLLAADLPPAAPLADAAMQGDEDRVRALIAEGADVNAAQGDGMTALHWAAERGNVKVAEMLLTAGADVRAVTRLGGYTPLHRASQNGHGAVARLLLQAGSDPEAVTEGTGGVTPLHFAAGAGVVDVVSALLDYGADPNVREAEWGQTPLMFAAASNRTRAIAELLRRGADPSVTARVLDVDEYDRLGKEVLKGLKAGMKLEEALAAAKAKPPEPGYKDMPSDGNVPYQKMVGTYGGLTALLLAARNGNIEAVRALLDGGADINEMSAGDRTSPLLVSTINGRWDVAMELVSRGADPNLASAPGGTPLYATIDVQWLPATRFPRHTHNMFQQTPYLELMEALLEAGADPNVRTKMELWYTVVGTGNLGVDFGGATPFWRAAHALDLDAMKLLVRYGADPNIPTSAVEIAPRRDNHLLKHLGDHDPSGVPPIEVGGPGHYPIHAAAGVGYSREYNWEHRHAPDGWMRAVRYLVEEHGADVNARDHYGATALHGAAARGDNEMIKYLVEKGADVTIVTRQHLTTADAANSPYQRFPVWPSTIELLTNLGAPFNNICVGC